MPIGNGFKKPLNMLENPVYPDIRKGPPRFRSSGKSWKVDVGQTLLDTEDVPGLYDSGVLVQSRDYNSQYAYGVSSHRSVVNEEFRPPLITRDDTLPLSRIPRSAVIPRINPGTTSDAGTSAYSAQIRPDAPDVSKFVTNRIKSREGRPSVFIVMDSPIDNSVLPDLEMIIPSISATSGFTMMTVDGQNSMSNMMLKDVNPSISATSGKNIPYHENFEVVPVYLEDNLPSISATSGRNVRFQRDGETAVNFDLPNNLPSVSATSGKNLPYKEGLTPVNFELDSKVTGGDILVLNPSSDYREDNSASHEGDMKLTNQPTFSYTASKEYQYKERTETKPFYREKQEALSKYKGYENKGYHPRSGLHVPLVKLK